MSAHPAALLARDPARSGAPFPRSIRSTGDAGTIALTFDDGPNPRVTPDLLRLLQRHHVVATFFVIGRHTRAERGLAGEMAAAGHVLGNHTDSHVLLPFTSAPVARQELARCSDAIAEACGERPRLLRPPYGLRRRHLKQIAIELGLQRLVMWSRVAWDWRPQEYERVARRLEAVRGGDVVLLHDGGPQPEADRTHVVRALAECLPRWIDAGYRFVPLDVDL